MGMRTLKALRTLPAIALMLCLGVAANASDAATQKVLRVAYNEDVATFDPDGAIIMFGLDVSRVLYEGLVQYQPGSSQIVGWLAQSWSISPDARTYRFNLRDGVVFHDGTVMTASDVLAYFKRRQTPSLPLSYFLDDVADMSAPDPHTFVITLKVPQPAFLDRLASAWAPKVIGPAALIDHAGGDLGVSWLNEHADGTGPFKLIEFSRGQRYVLLRNTHYWGVQPYFDKIEIFIVPSTSQQMLMLQRGEIDIVEHGYPFDQLSKLPPGLQIDAHDGLGLEMAYFNQSKALRDPAVRTAVMTAINPTAWLSDAFGPFATPARSLYPESHDQRPECGGVSDRSGCGATSDRARRAGQHRNRLCGPGRAGATACRRIHGVPAEADRCDRDGAHRTARSGEQPHQQSAARTRHLHCSKLSRCRASCDPDRCVLRNRGGAQLLRLFEPEGGRAVRASRPGDIDPSTR
jgi:ABC-type transport system substrate-binding protein